MKKIIFYGFIILLVYKLLGGLWDKITLDEEEEVQKFTQKIEMLKSSKDFYDVGNTSREYLSFLNENIDWFTAEQSKAISTELNYLRDYAKSKIDSIDDARAAKKEEEKKRIQLEEAEKLNAEKKTNKKKLSKSKKPVKSKNVINKKREEELCSYDLHRETILKTQLELNGRKIYGAIYDFQGDKISDCQYIWFVQFSTLSGRTNDAGFRTSLNKNKGKISVELYDGSTGSFGSPVYVNPAY
jgi:hypothetical protein